MLFIRPKNSATNRILYGNYNYWGAEYPQRLPFSIYFATQSHFCKQIHPSIHRHPQQIICHWGPLFLSLPLVPSRLIFSSAVSFWSITASQKKSPQPSWQANMGIGNRSRSIRSITTSCLDATTWGNGVKVQSAAWSEKGLHPKRLVEL